MSQPSKHNEKTEPDELLRAGEVLAERIQRSGRPRGTSPHGVILCHQAAPVARVLTRWHAWRLPGFHADVRVLRRTMGHIAVATGFGVGAPAAVGLLEELAAFGVREFVSIGIAGGLEPTQQAGELIVADHAWRSEGTSAHYLPPADTVEPSPLLTARLASALTVRGRSHSRGMICTTDAPYRTTLGTVKRWAAAGGLAVEMEAAGLFAAARVRGVSVAAAVCIADALSSHGWNLAFDGAAVTAGLRILFDAAVEALERSDRSGS